MNKYDIIRFSIIGALGLLVLAVLVVPIFVWTSCRIEPSDGEFAILIKKTGENPDPSQVIAKEGQKGVQLEVIPEGRHFRNPFFWDWKYAPMTDVPSGQMAVLNRLYGDNLPDGEIIAREGTKGILKDVLSPGKYRINPLAYSVHVFPASTIQPGSVGVQISLTGSDPLHGEIENLNTFIVDRGEKGVIESTLDPGTYYLNPYMYSIVPVNLQSKRFEMSGDDSIDFLTMDGFTVKVEGTVEYAIKRESAALLTHRVGDGEDILQKVILPRARGFGRIEGSKGNALNYIVGEMRQEFQDKLFAHLRDQCARWGVEIRSVLVRNITPPDQIASVIRDRELAKQAAIMFEQQINQAKSKAELARQEMLAQQNKERVDAETAKLQAEIKASQEAQVRLTKAEQNLEVSKLNKEAAQEQAGGIIAKASGEREVVKLENEARASVLARQSAAFGGGANYANYLFYKKVAPNVESILANDGDDGVGAIFKPFLNQ